MKETKKRKKLFEASEQIQQMEPIYYETIFFKHDQVKQNDKYSREKWMNFMISQGETDKLKKVIQSFVGTGVGQLSRKPFRQQLYTIIIGVAIASRAAIEGGLKEDVAYSLCDIYIQKADSCNSTGELWTIYGQAVIALSEQVRAYHVDHQMSHAIRIAIDYILSHLHSDVNLKEIAEEAGFSETYFSALFKKETGDTVTEFIQKSRIEEAKNLLQYSEYSLTNISQYLGFCSQSHFSQTFRKYMDMTPGQYRKKHFKQNW